MAKNVHTHTYLYVQTSLSVPDFLPLGERQLLFEMKTDNRCSFVFFFFFSLLASFQVQTLRHLRFPSDGGEQCWTGFITCGKQKLAEKKHDVLVKAKLEREVHTSVHDADSLLE